MKMPYRTCTTRNEANAPKSKAQKNNAVGFMMNPGFIYKLANIGTVKTWITKSLSLNCFHQCFTLQAKEYFQNVCM